MSHMGKEQVDLIQVDIENMLKKVAIQQPEHQAGGFLSNIFLVGKRDGGTSTSGELKIFKRVHSISAFQNGRFVLSPRITARGRLHVQAGYDFSVPLHQSSRNYVRFSWSGNLYEFFCLCFGLGPAPKIFTKLLKIPVSVLRRTNIWIVIYIRMHWLSWVKQWKKLSCPETNSHPPATFRFCFKPGEVHFESSSGNRVSWGDNKFFEDVSVFTTRKGVKNSESVSGCLCQRSGDSS